MAFDQSAKSTETPAWWKIFAGFRVALDIKKLLLAAAGIFFTALGWWVISATFYSMRTMPQFADFTSDKMQEPEKEEAFKRYKRSLAQWNLLHSLAGPTPTDAQTAIRIGPGDIADNVKQFNALTTLVGWHEDFGKSIVISKHDTKEMRIGGETYLLSSDLTRLADKGYKTQDLTFSGKDVFLGTEKLEGEDHVLEKLRSYENRNLSIEAIEQRVLTKDPAKRDANLVAALKVFKAELANPKIKPTAKFRPCPWSEERGPNPYLIVSSLVSPSPGDERPFERGTLLRWLVFDQLPVLLEPLIKLFSPIYYLFQPAAGGWNRVYLAVILMWSLLVWGYFGGAITRMAVVQAARNEKISMGEAVAFARQRLTSYFLAPTMPLICLGFITLLLAIFGLVEGFVPWFGDIVLAGLFWPLLIIAGLVMAVVLVGLVGYPLMSPTISAEGSDSFDALSRSYSYVYQAPWQFVWYSLVALAYGAALVFFVVFMGSLMVYLGKWGMSRAPWLEGTPQNDRTPVYFVAHAPTSFGWRDVLLSDSPYAVPETYIAPSGDIKTRLGLSEAYREELSIPNKIGAWMVTFWIGLVFLLVVGFGYSYFWTASSILYLLMRKHVDETDMDEVHLEEDDLNLPPPPAPPPAAEAKPNTVSLNIVDAPPKAEEAPPKD